MEITGNAIIAVSGNNVYEDLEFSGQSSKILILDSKMYILDDVNNVAVYMMDVPEDQDANPMGGDFTNFVALGTKDVNGTECYFETYEVSGAEVSYYFIDDELYAFDTNISGVVITMVITEFTESCDESLLVIPDSMTQMTYQDYLAMTSDTQQ
jgi:hypothetical protein